jgi:phage FluMu gp28-like protein
MTTTVDIPIPVMRPDQRRVFYSPASYVLLMCGRRWGKTTGAYSWICDGVLEAEPLAWFAPTYTYLDTVWHKTIRDLAPMIAHQDAQKHRIRFVTGASLHFWSMDKPDPGRGEKYKRVVVDEAGLVRKFGPVWKEAIFPTLADYRGRAILQGTPKGSSRDFTKLHAVAKQGENGYASFSGKTADNPVIDPAWIENAKRTMTPEAFAQEFEGIPAEDGANPFGLPAIAACTGEMSGEPAVVYGVDLASSMDWTVVIGLDADGRMCYMDRFQGDWEHVTNRVRQAISNTFALIDSTGVGQPIVERLQINLENVEGRKFTQQSKHEMMVGLAAAFQTRELRIANDPTLIYELESFGYEHSDKGVARYSAPSGIHDDCVCALALAWSAFRDNYGPQSQIPVYHSVPYMNRQPSRAGVSW